MNVLKKYSAKSVEDLVGIESEVKGIIDFLKDFRVLKKKALLLVGPEGSGKTSSVYAVANSLGFDVVEVNASDKRNAENIKSIVGGASKQAGLFSKNKIILIDEVDGLSGNSDRGGVREINSIIKSTSFPIIMTANDEYSSRLESVKQNSSIIRFKKRGYWHVYNFIKLINDFEKKGLSVISLKKVASMAQGDVRSALNDLGNVESDADVNELFERAKESSIFDALKIIFKSKTVESLLQSVDNLRGMDVRDVVSWVHGNICNEYEKPHELRDAYDWTSRADVFLGRIGRRMYWRFLVYAKLFSTVGVGLSKDEMYRKFSRYYPPMKMRGVSKNSKIRAENKAFGVEFSGLTHCSSKKALKEYSPFFKKSFLSEKGSV
ncbi:MAG: replication factor C large subunit [Candidatus Nanoarchaeia archaeon]|nr:replication factor C large subunit [Candidatus Nanoarchaeia archaeon]